MSQITAADVAKLREMTNVGMMDCKKALTEAKHHRVKLTTHIVVGHAVPAIVDFIERDGFDLLVTGFMGHSALYNRVIGSTTDRLVELAPCTVLVVK